MQEFYCRGDAGAECDAEFTATNKTDLMSQIREHVIRDHGIENPSKTILDYLASTVRETSGHPAR